MIDIHRYLNSIFENKYTSTIVTMILIVYASHSRSKLPSIFEKLFNNPIFRIFILSLIVYRGNKDPRFSIIVAVGFSVIMDILSKQKIIDTFTDIDTPDINTPDINTSDIDYVSDDGNIDSNTSGDIDVTNDGNQVDGVLDDPSTTQNDASVDQNNYNVDLDGNNLWNKQSF